MTAPLIISRTKLLDMPIDELAIRETVRKFGIIRTDQLAKFLGFTENDKEKYEHYIKDLIYFRECGFTVTPNGYIVSSDKMKHRQGTAECLWDPIYNKNDIDFNLIDKAEEPCDIFYQTNSGLIVMDTFIDSKTINNVEYIQERYYARQYYNGYESEEDNADADLGLLHIFVVEDMKVARQVVQKYNLTMPYQFCYIDYSNLDERGIPSINYLTPKS